MLKKLTSSNLFVKWTNWEYWPMWLVYIPVIPIVLFYVLKTRRWFFFSNVNPDFKTGALLGASKFNILEKVPTQYRPKTVFIDKNDINLDTIKKSLLEEGIDFPLIVKPDVGERGLLVALIKNETQLKSYIQANQIDIIVQEFINLPNECGIFYVRKPFEDQGAVVSIGLKDFLALKGDGTSTVRELMSQNPRAKLQLERFEIENQKLLNSIPKNNNVINLEPIGNHSRGTCFMDGSHLKSKKIDQLFDTINAEMDEVYYGRFDIKYDTWEDLLNGKNFKIIEMNGVASEPIHVYDQNVKIRDKYKTFYDLWKTIYEISAIQRARGFDPINVFAAYKIFREYKKYVKGVNTNWQNDKQISLS